jgi:hypothetical protein
LFRYKYSRERYQRLHALVAEIIAGHIGLDVGNIDMLFSQQAGYATPKLGVRGAVVRGNLTLPTTEFD